MDDVGSNPGWDVFLRHRAQAGSGTHPASYVMITEGEFFPRGKAAGVWSWPTTSI
jgi:hypothetical protein